jgi:antigen flippase
MSQDRYRSVLKSSSLVGGAAMFNILIGMAKTKFVALWLGPAGIGLMNLFGSLVGPVATIAGMGIGTSGVRQIAEANGSGDWTRISKVAIILRRTVWATGTLGAVLMALLSGFLSERTFGHRDYQIGIALLGLTILMGNIAGGQACVIQGTRRIRDLATLQVMGAVNGTLISLPLFYLMGVDGIIPTMLLGSAVGLLTSWIFARRVPIQQVEVKRDEALREIKALLGFGLPMMLSGLQTSVIAYFIRLVLVNRFGLEGVGQWSAAFGISGILVGFVLQAMGADYFPRLTAVNKDPLKMCEEVNAQAHVALVLALPALLATLLFAPLAIKLFYSGRFDEAIPILRWSIFGAFGRVVTWPLGFVILAKGMGKTFFIVELIAHAGHLFWIWLLTGFFGLTGTGMAWAATYIVGFIVVGSIIIVNIKFRWSRANLLWITVSLGLLVGGFWMERLPLNEWVLFGLSALLVGVVGLFCLRELSRMSGWSGGAVWRRIRRG